MARKGSSLAKLFIRSVVRQVGRDTGKVVSNKAFGDAHATPIRMVRSADTGPVTSASGRRKFRHALDRVINNELPSTKASAKKALVTLENAFQDFVSSNLQVSNVDELAHMLAWIEKSIDYADDVIRIVNNPEVEKIANEVTAGIIKQKQQVVDALGKVSEPVAPDLRGRRNWALALLLGPFGLLLLLGFLHATGLSPIESHSDTFMGVVLMSSMITPFISISMLMKNRRAVKNYASLMAVYHEMKSLVKGL